ncbi:putative arginine--tRNA ligase [Helianthus annuus]|uniref:arginine--tRNA ligase n=1 Tax=Helianthus annuus TaxID=4232 RepID=A0A251VAZ4_HELAN|nr:arginine--tRNA ligase, cytoplasmic [Helianthus annuus]XP_022029137.1 arginine--tRNA ligase, cytoplasmic [Helianthus annuus]KAF5815520.1 putative arginine--tRNA ligase [Helianthus annuus]
MADAPEDNTGSLKEQLAKVFEVSIKVTVPDESQVVPIIAPCSKKESGDYQCNNAMSLWSKIKGKGTEFKGPQPVGQAIMRNLPASDMIESCSVAGPGFINVKLSTQWIAKSIQKMLIDGIDTWAPKLPVKRAVVDFSSPNIAKEMHVGHLRSTIIGDTLARMLEYSKVDVLRRNHVGDWGTQFGMLIEFLFEKFPDGEVNDQDIGELEVFYKASKQRFDGDKEFKETAQQAVVRLQGGEEKYRKAWAQICEISRRGFEQVYRRLGVHLEEKGESFYNPYIPGTLDLLRQKGLIKNEAQAIKFKEGQVIKIEGAKVEKNKEDLVIKIERGQVITIEGAKVIKNEGAKVVKIEGARVIKTEEGEVIKNEKGEVIKNEEGKVIKVEEGQVIKIEGAQVIETEGGQVIEIEGAQVIEIEGKDIPLIVVKKDGGYNYASTDLAALWYRLNEEKAEWIIYLTDVGQREHFEMFFAAAKLAGWLPTDKNKYPKTSHVGFGLVLGDDKKRFRTRSTEVVKLVDLLDEAKRRCKEALEERGKAAQWTPEELEQTSEAIGYGAVKYADLKNNRLTNYTFNFDQMLNDKGNTAVYLLYAHARICSIIRKSGKDIEELKREGQLKLERDEERKLGLHLLQFPEAVKEACTNLLPNVLCEYLYDLSEKFTSFYSECQVVGSAEERSRLLLCEATAVVMRKCFYLLGITPVYKI